jgi:uncharacterized membrane protein
VTPNRAFLLAIPFVLAVETGIFYALAALDADGQLAVTVEMIWLCVAVVLVCLFMGRYEHEGGDDSGE